MTDMAPILDAIGACADSELDLADAALQLARVDAPGIDWLAAREHLSEIARGAAFMAHANPTGNLKSQARRLKMLLNEEFGYTGDTVTYDDEANANLLHVIERRRGLPVALGIIWLHAAAAAGWPAQGVNLPGHFLIALGEGESFQRLMIDVFDGGATVSSGAVNDLLRGAAQAGRWPGPATLSPMSGRAILLRLQANIRLRRVEAGDLAGALTCAENTLRVVPQNAALWHETGVLQEQLEQLGAALQSYERSLALCPSGHVTMQAEAAIARLRARLH